MDRSRRTSLPAKVGSAWQNRGYWLQNHPSQGQAETPLPRDSVGHSPSSCLLPEKQFLRLTVETGSPGRKKAFYPAVAEDCGQNAAVQLSLAPLTSREEPLLLSKPSPVFHLWFQESSLHCGLEQYYWAEGRAPVNGSQIHRREEN